MSAYCHCGAPHVAKGMCRKHYDESREEARRERDRERWRESKRRSAQKRDAVRPSLLEHLATEHDRHFTHVVPLDELEWIHRSLDEVAS